MDRRSFIKGSAAASALAAVSIPAFSANRAILTNSSTSENAATSADPSNPAVAKGNPASGRNTTVFNVRDFGASGDGRTSDSAAIQKAIDAAAKVSGTVFFPAGVYLCHSLKVPASVNLSADPVWQCRAEKVGAVLQLDDEQADCLLDITGALGVHVYGLVLSGIRNAAKPIHGIYQHNEDGDFPKCPKGWSVAEDTFVFDDIKVMNFSGHGIYLKNAFLFILRHSQLQFNGWDGMRIRGWDGFVTDNQFSANAGNGFGCETVGATVMFTANRVEWNGAYGLYACWGDDWNVTGNSFDRCFGPALFLDHVQAAAVTGNVFRRSGKTSAGAAPGEKSCHVKLVSCRGVSVTGNTFLAGRDDGGVGKDTPQVGMVLEDLACTVISGNTMFEGYMEQMTQDFGSHGDDFIFRDNVGTIHPGV